MATRWERLLEAIGVNPDIFERDHASKFDLHPESWVNAQLQALDDDDEVVADIPCKNPCCTDDRSTATEEE